MSQMISLGQIIDKTFHTYQKHFPQYMRLGVWLLLTTPLTILVLEPVVHTLSNDIMTIVAIVAGALLLNTVLSIVVGIFVQNALIFATDAFDKGKDADVRTLQKSAWSRLGVALVQWLLVAIMIVGAIFLVLPGLLMFMSASYTENAGVVVPALGMFLLFVGGVAALLLLAWFSVIFPFMPMKLIVERRGIVDSIKGAFALVRGRWWATAVRVLVPKLLFGVIVAFGQLLVIFLFFVISAAFAPLTELIGESAVVVIVTVLQQLAVTGMLILTTPAFVIADYYVFSDLTATRATP